MGEHLGKSGGLWRELWGDVLWLFPKQIPSSVLSGLILGVVYGVLAGVLGGLSILVVRSVGSGLLQAWASFDEGDGYME